MVTKARQTREGLDTQTSTHDDTQVRFARQRSVSMKFLWKLFAEEDDVWLDNRVTLGNWTVRDFFLADGLLHHILRIFRFAINAPVTSEAAVGFNDLIAWHTCFSVKTINILSEQFEQKAFVVEQANESM